MGNNNSPVPCVDNFENIHTSQRGGEDEDLITPRTTDSLHTYIFTNVIMFLHMCIFIYHLLE